jgi:hypothetical protein
MAGILGDKIEVNPNAPPRPPRTALQLGGDPEAAKAIFLAIEESARCREIEQVRAEVASHFRGVIDDDLRWATDRALGQHYSKHTIRQYKGMFGRFRDWCSEHKYPSLPSTPEIVAAYLLEQAADMKPTELERILAAVKWAHLLYDQGGPRLMHHSCNFDDPLLVAVLRFARRCHDEEQAKKAE